MNPPPDDELDPFERHFHRDPLPRAGVSVVIIAGQEADRIARGLLDLIQSREREAEAIIVDPDEGWARALSRGLETASLPLVLVTTSTAPWTDAHLDPLLKAIDHCDHVVGRRRLAVPLRIARRWKSIGWRTVFAVPVSDPHSPCQLHRREALAAIPAQSASPFLGIEILAKATFLGHLIDEVTVPWIDGQTAPGYGGDLMDVFRHPVFRHPASTPAEELQGQREGAHGPGPEDQKGHPDHLIADAGPF